MDKLTAYRILGLANNASTEEVKEAYARLSKEYHPEENPEEFQQIHEAYVMLTRGGRRANRTMAVESSPIEKDVKPEVKESNLVFRNVQKVEEEENEEEQAQSDFNFDASIEQAELEQGKKQWEILIQADRELKILFASSNYKKPDKFKAFFQKEEYKEVLYTREFAGRLIQCLSKEKLLPELYSYIIDFYRLKMVSFDELDQDLQKLYQVIARHYDVEKDTYQSHKTINKNAMLAIIVYVVALNGNRIANIFEENVFQVSDIIGSIVPYVMIAGVGILLYRMLRRQFSTYVSQAVLAAIYAVVGIGQTFFFQYLYDYTDMLGSKLPLLLSTVFLWASIDWLFIIGITAFIQSLRKKNNK